MIHIGELWIQNEQEVHLARQWTQRLARWGKLSIGNHARLTTAVSQISQSFYYYNQCVYLSFDLYEEAKKQWLQITLREAKNFIPSPGQRQQPALSRQDLIKWLGSTQNLITRFSIQAEEGKPIEVVLAKPLPSWAGYMTIEDVQAWREGLNNELPLSLLEEILQQNQELVQVLDALREKDKTLEQKVTEIQKLENFREELVHALVHDLRNPLATIRSSLSGLLYNETKNLSPYQITMIEISYLGARKMTRLVDNILEVHKLEREALPFDPKPFSVSKLVQKVIKAQKPLASERNVRLSRWIAHDLPPIEGDIRLIERVLQNLIDNALKFTPEGGRVIVTGKCLETQTISEGGVPYHPPDRFVSVSVKDSGPGVPAELETHLFEKFSAGFHEESGSGLGLAFCRMAVQVHGGEIWAKNNSGQGSTFTFILPLFPPKEVNDG